MAFLDKLRNIFTFSAPLPPKTLAPGPVVLPPERTDSLADYAQVPEHVRKYLASLKDIDGNRADSFLDGLIGHNGSNRDFNGGWVNPVTGMGTRRDKVTHGRFDEARRIDDPTLTALFNGNDIAQTIVSAKAEEMFRRGWLLNLPGGPNDVKKTMADAAPKPMQPEGTAKGAKPPVPPRPQDGTPTQGKVPEVRHDADVRGGDFTNTDINGAPAKNAPPDPHAGEGESGPAAPSIQAVPGTDSRTPPPDGPAGDQNNKADLAKAAEKYAERLTHLARLKEAEIFGRLYGGGILIMGLDDGQDMAEPLDETNIQSMRYLTWIDRRFVVAHSYYETIGPRYGEIEVYNVINPFGNQSNQYIHESRVLRFEGAPVDLLMRRRLAGWTLSVLQAPIDSMRQFDTSYQSVSHLMSDISQAVMKLKGLAQMISQDPRTLQTRMAMVDMSRSASRMVFLDAEFEDFERVATPLTGVSDVMQMQMLRLAAAARMPVALLFGREPSGLNATGDADFRRFYDQIAGQQKQILEPKLQRLYSLIFLCKDGPTGGKAPDGGIEFTWHKLYAPSEVEQSTIRWNMAQADDKYIANGTLLPEEVAMSRFRSGDLHLDTEIQGDLRREKLASAQLAPSGAEKFQADQENKKAELRAKVAIGGMKAGGKPPAPGARADGEERLDGTITEDVLADLEDDYPEDAIAWVKAVRWTGPEKVKISEIDMSGRAKWRASRDDLGPYVRRMEKGKQKPILLVETPGNDKYIVVDGHHRLLAAEKLGKPVLAYCAKVFHDEGPWDTMHDSQHSGPSKED